MRSNRSASVSCFVLLAGATFFACASEDSSPLFESDDAGSEAGRDASKDRTVPDEDAGNEPTDSGTKDAGKDSGSTDAGKTDGGTDAGKIDGGDAGVDAGPTTRIFYSGDFVTNNDNALGRALVPAGAGNATTSTIAMRATAFAFTPDGSKVAYAADAATVGTFDLHVANADGTGDVVRVQMPNARKVTELAISPDGASIAYLADAETAGQADVYVVALAGATAPILMSPNGTRANGNLDAQAISWSRDSKHVAMSGDFTVDTKNELYVVDVTAGTPMPVAALAEADIPAPVASTIGVSTGLAPIWTSGGKVCVKANLAAAAPAVFRLYCANANGTGFATPANFPALPAQLGSYGISPDGATLAFSADSATAIGAYEIYKMPADDSAAPSRVTSGTITAPAAGKFTGPDFTIPLRFGPDGTKIAFAGDLLVENRFELYVVPVNGATPEKRVAIVGADGDATRSVGAFVWSPDGTALAVVADHRGNNVSELFRILDVTTADQAPVLVQGVPTSGDVGDLLEWRP